MPPLLALAICVTLILAVLLLDRKRGATVSWAVWLPLFWYAIAATRPLSVWVTHWGYALTPGANFDPTEGSIFDRTVFSILIAAGLLVLYHRRRAWGAIAFANTRFLLLYGFMAMSILWSNYPYVSLKRFIMSCGDVVMALVILTEPAPLDAIRTVIRRCAIFHIPLSILCVKYFRDIGVLWNWSGEAQSWLGIATSKNTLGQVAATSALIFIWERMQGGREWRLRAVDWVYIAMSLYLLKGSDDAFSLTSLSVFALGSGVMLALNVLKPRWGAVKLFMAAGVTGLLGLLSVFTAHTLLPFKQGTWLGLLMAKMGRDITLTGRTEIWSDVLKLAAKSSLMGVGFGGFWIGRVANIPWSEQMSWTLGQAHNGYFDVYLQLGWVGMALLLGVIIASARGIGRSLATDFEYGRFRMAVFLMVILINITESTFLRGNHNMWFLFLLATLSVPEESRAPARDPRPTRAARATRRLAPAGVREGKGI
jgi:O-antigen ligase